MDLDETVSATMPSPSEDDDLFPGIVSGSQLDRKGRSGWPVHEGCSEWDEDKDTWALAHSKEDKSKGIRPYLVDITVPSGLSVGQRRRPLARIRHQIRFQVQRCEPAGMAERRCGGQCHRRHRLVPLQAHGAGNGVAAFRCIHAAMVCDDIVTRQARLRGAVAPEAQSTRGRHVHGSRLGSWTDILAVFPQDDEQGRQDLGLDEEAAARGRQGSPVSGGVRCSVQHEGREDRGRSDPVSAERSG